MHGIVFVWTIVSWNISFMIVSALFSVLIAQPKHIELPLYKQLTNLAFNVARIDYLEQKPAGQASRLHVPAEKHFETSCQQGLHVSVEVTNDLPTGQYSHLPDNSEANLVETTPGYGEKHSSDVLVCANIPGPQYLHIYSLTDSFGWNRPAGQEEHSPDSGDKAYIPTAAVFAADGRSFSP